MNEKKFRYFMIIEYLGALFAGSQIQPGQKTIQSEIERAINILIKDNIKTVFAGRTDSKVHALNQTLHFNTNQEINKKKFVYSLNALLPDEINVKEMQKVDKSFHSQKSATYRWYRYLINNRQYSSVLLKNISFHIPGNLNVDEMQKALNYITGLHDFSSFKSAGSDNPAKECNMFYACCKKKSDIIYIDLIANRFLYKMVRIITGTLIKTGSGVLKAEDMLDVLNAKDRTCAGPTANAKGLTLMYVGYEEKCNFNELIKMEAKNEQNILCEAS